MSNVFLDMAYDAGFTGKEALQRAKDFEEASQKNAELYIEEEEEGYASREEKLENEREQYGDYLHDLQMEGEWPPSRW